MALRLMIHSVGFDHMDTLGIFSRTVIYPLIVLVQICIKKKFELEHSSAVQIPK